MMMMKSVFCGKKEQVRCGWYLLFRALMVMKGNRVLRDQMDKRYGNEMVHLYR